MILSSLNTFLPITFPVVFTICQVAWIYLHAKHLLHRLFIKATFKDAPAAVSWPFPWAFGGFQSRPVEPWKICWFFPDILGNIPMVIHHLVLTAMFVEIPEWKYVLFPSPKNWLTLISTYGEKKVVRMIFMYLGARLISAQLPPAPCPRGTTWQDLAEMLVHKFGASKICSFQRRTRKLWHDFYNKHCNFGCFAVFLLLGSQTFKRKQFLGWVICLTTNIYSFWKLMIGR